MTARVAIGRTDGMLTSVGLILNGLPFLCRGPIGAPVTGGLSFQPREVKRQAVIELSYIVAYLAQAGVIIENREGLDALREELCAD